MSALSAGCVGPVVTRVTVLNETPEAMLVSAWVVSNQPADQERLEPGGSWAWSFPYEGDEPRVSVIAEPASPPATNAWGGVADGALMPTSATLDPGPMLVRIRVGLAGLEILAEPEPGAPRELLIPPDPRREGFVNDLPPTQPSRPLP